MLDDEPFFLELMEMALKLHFPDSTVVTFTNSHEAFAELMKESTDLFTTDWNHVGISCDEMLRRLAERKVRYPVFVISGVGDLSVKRHVEKFADRGLNVCYLLKVGEDTLSDFLREMTLRLGLLNPARPDNQHERGDGEIDR